MTIANFNPRRVNTLTDEEINRFKSLPGFARIAELYGVEPEELIRSSGKVAYTHDRYRAFLDRIKLLEAAEYTRLRPELEIMAAAHGLKFERIERARQEGAGPRRRGWAAVHAARAAAAPKKNKTLMDERYSGEITVEIAYCIE